MNYYLITIKKNRLEKNTNFMTKKYHSILDDIITYRYKFANKMPNNKAYENAISMNDNTLIKVAYENDKKMRYHLHAIVKLKEKLEPRRLKQYHIDIKSFPESDLKKVLRYLTKEPHSDLTHHYYHNYSMI